MSAALNTQPELRESMFREGAYWLFNQSDEQAILQTNSDGGPPDEPADESYASGLFRCASKPSGKAV